ASRAQSGRGSQYALGIRSPSAGVSTRASWRSATGSRCRRARPGGPSTCARRRGTMTRPAQTEQHPRPGRPPRGLHSSWVIVGILVVVQVIGSAISQSAGVMVAPLRDPHGGFGWGIGTIGGLMAVYYVVGAVFAPISGWLGERYGARCLMLVGG